MITGSWRQGFILQNLLEVLTWIMVWPIFSLAAPLRRNASDVFKKQRIVKSLGSWT